jgi:hypothetical protein
MAKQTGKNAIVLINGYVLSPSASAYEVTQSVNPIEITGFTDGSVNYCPGIISAQMSIDMMFDSVAGNSHAVLNTAQLTGIASLLPMGYVLGNPVFSLPFLQSTYTPKSAPDARIDVGSIAFNSYGGNNVGVESGVALQHGAITTTLTGVGVDDPTAGAVTAVCGGELHIWSACAADTYVVKIQHSANNSTWADLITFTADGSAILAERQTLASGTINRYRRVLATRTGAAGNSFGLTVTFWHG